MKRVGLWVLSKLRERPGRWVLSVLSLLYIFVLPEVFGRDDIFAFISNREKGLNEVGDFLAGFFTPLAFAWLVYGYFLQSRELGLQRQELALTRDKLGEQVELLKKRDETEYQRSLPRLKLEETGISGKDRNFQIRNTGSDARKLELSRDGEEPRQKPKLATDECYEFSILNDGPACSYKYEARFISDRGERFYQRWKIQRTGSVPPFEYEEITKGPTPLEEG